MCESCDCVAPFIVNALKTCGPYNELKRKLSTIDLETVFNSKLIDINLPENQSSFYLHTSFLPITLEKVVDWINSEPKSYKKTVDSVFLDLFQRTNELKLFFGLLTLLLLTSASLTLRIVPHYVYYYITTDVLQFPYI